MTSLVDYLQTKLEAAAEPLCSCPDCDVSTPADPGATVKGWSRHCPIHGVAGTHPPGGVGYGSVTDHISTLVYLHHAGWTCRECRASGDRPDGELRSAWDHADSHYPPRRKRWWNR